MIATISWSGSGLSKVLVEPLHNRHICRDGVGGLAIAVAFVGKKHVLDRHAAFLEIIHDLIRFDDRHVGVVGAMNYQRRRFDAIDLMYGRQSAQEIGLGFWVAVFD